MSGKRTFDLAIRHAILTEARRRKTGLHVVTSHVHSIANYLFLARYKRLSLWRPRLDP